MSDTNQVRRIMRHSGLVVRELLGWILLAMGLFIFYTCFGYLNNGQMIEAMLGTVIGYILFRGGLQLVKVAVAARVLRRATKARVS